MTYSAAKVTSGICGLFNYPFPKHGYYFRGTENTEFSWAVTCTGTRPVTPLELLWGARWSKGEHKPVHRVYFVFHTPPTVPLPAAGCPRAASTAAATLPSPPPPRDLLPTSPSQFGFLPLHVLSRESGSTHGAGWQPRIQAGTPVSLGKASQIFSPHAHQGHSRVFVHPETA